MNKLINFFISLFFKYLYYQFYLYYLTLASHELGLSDKTIKIFFFLYKTITKS